MEKIKEVLHIGHKKHDEETQPEGQVPASVTQPTTEPSSSTAPLYTTPAAEKKEHGVLRQILNPGGEKYDSAAFGDNATTTLGSPENPAELVTDPGVEKQDHPVARQIFNPDGNKYDPVAFGTTAHATGDIGVPASGSAPLATVDPDVKLETDPEQKKHEHSILRQILNPGGDKYSEESYGVTAHAAAEPSDATSTAAATTDSHVGRDAALAGTGGAVVGGVAAAAEHKQHSDNAASPNTVPSEVIASQKEAHVAPEAAANPEAVVEKSAVESELLSKVPEAPAVDATTSSTGAAGSSAAATAIPAAVIASQQKAHTEPEAAANPEAVAEKSAVEKELLSKVHETTTAPTTSQEEPSAAARAIVPVAAASAVTGDSLASHTNDSSIPASKDLEQINKPTGANDVEAATYTYSSTPVGIGASTVQADVNSIANLSARPEGEGVAADAPSLGVVHGHAIHDVEQDAGAASVGAVASTAAAQQVNQPRADNDIADATVVERSYPVGTTEAASSSLAAEPQHSSALPIAAAATAGGVAGAGLAAHSAAAHEPATTENEGTSAAVGSEHNSEKKPSIIDKILHPFHHKEKEHTPTVSAADSVKEPANDFPAPAIVQEPTPTALPVAAAAPLAAGLPAHADHGSSPIQTTTNTLSGVPSTGGASAPITSGPHISPVVNDLDPNVPLDSKSVPLVGATAAAGTYQEAGTSAATGTTAAEGTSAAIGTSALGTSGVDGTSAATGSTASSAAPVTTDRAAPAPTVAALGAATEAGIVPGTISTWQKPSPLPERPGQTAEIPATHPSHTTANPTTATLANTAAPVTTGTSAASHGADKNEGISAADTVTEPANEFPAPATVIEPTPTALPAATAAPLAAGLPADPDHTSSTGTTALPHMSDKHERKLQKAREEEAEIGGDRGAETKPSLIEKILHPFHHKDKEHDLPLPTTVAGEPVDSSTHDAAVAAAQKAPHTAHPASST